MEIMERTYPSNPIDWLRNEYSERRSRNPRYSLRAFAAHLGISSGPLTEILLQKRELTARQAEVFAKKLEFSPEERDALLKLIENKNSTKRRKKTLIKFAKVGLGNALSEDTFRFIADWYHFAILSLLLTHDCKSEPKWIGERLGISATEVRLALDRMKKLGLIEKTKLGWKNKGPLSTTTEVPSKALRRFHRQVLEQAAASLEEVPLEMRDITSMTFAMNMEKMSEAKKLIRKFRTNMAFLLEEGKTTEVYRLNIQLVPVTKERKP